MKHFLLSLCLVASAFAYSTDVPTKTVTGTGTAADTESAMAWIRSNVAEDGWTLVIGSAGGTYTWLRSEVTNSEIDFRTNYTLTVRGASPTNRPTITYGPNLLWGYASGKLLTVKDFIFVKGESGYNSIGGSGSEPGFRFTNIRWENMTGALFYTGTAGGNAGTSEEGPYGLFDNCSTEGGDCTFFIYCNNGSTDEMATSPSWRRPMEWGTVKAVYIEDCDFRYTTGEIGGSGLTDNWNGGSFVFRRNRIENMMLANHGADHYSNAVKGALKHEIYDNDFYISSGTSEGWIVFLRGGTAAIYDNRFHTSNGTTSTNAIYWDYYRANSGSGPSNSIYDRFYNTLSTTIAAGSNGVDLASVPFTVNVADTTAFLDNPVDLVGPVYTKIAAGSNGATLPQGTINVASTTDFPSSGILRIGIRNQVGTLGDFSQVTYTGKTSTTFTGCTGGTRTLTTGDVVAGVATGETAKFAIYIENIKITTSAGIQTVSATGKTATTFTGVIGGTGTMSTGAAVTRASDYLGTQQPGSGTITALIAAGSNGATLPQGTINVDSTVGFPSTGTLVVNYDWEDGISQTAGKTVTYTGKTATTFTGCTGGTVTMTTGQVVAGIGQDPRHPLEPWGSMPIWHWNNTKDAGVAGAVTGQSVHDFIGSNIQGVSRDLYIHDSDSTKPTSTGTWLDNYTPLGTHPLRAGESSSNPRHTPRNARGLGVSRRR